MRLLIADDDTATRRILRAYVSPWGHEVIECGNGIDALARLEAPDRPAVAILDWMMPGLDGPEVCRRLRAAENQAYVILLTTRTTPSDVVRGLSAGADEHLAKTLPAAELRARLEAALRVATLRDQVAQQMRELRVLFDASPCAMWVAGETTHEILEVNDAACELYGYTADAFRRLSESDLVAGRSTAGDSDIVRHRCRDGRLIDVQVATHAITFRGCAARLVLAQDVTRRARVERLTRLQLGVTRVLADAATPADAWPALLQLLCEGLDFDGATVRESGAIRGTPLAEWKRAERTAADREGAWPEHAVRVMPVLVGSRTLAIIRLHARETPAIAPESLDLLPILASQIGQFLSRKQSEAALQQALANLRALVAGSPLPIATYDQDGVVQMWNAAAERTFGWSEAEILGKDNPVVPPDRQEESSRFRASVLRGEAISGVQVQRRTKDGRLLDVCLWTAPLRGPDGVATGVMTIFQDITEEKAVERELLHAHAETERLFSAIASVLIGLTPDRRVTRWNSAAASTFNCKASDAFGRALRDCPIHWDAQVLERHIADCQQRRARVDLNDFPYVIDDHERFLNIVLTPVTTGREAGGVVLLASDVTEYRLLQTQLGQAQKLESIGQLAAGVAHEINTPMQYVGDNVAFLRDSWPLLREALAPVLRERDEVAYLVTEIPNAIEQTLEGVARMSAIVGAMKELSHPGATEPTPLDINRVIATTITVARHEWKYVCDIETDLDPDLPLVPCLPGELNQVILNLLVNAAQAIAEAGAGSAHQPRGRITIRTRQLAGHIDIAVADTGPGIADAIRSRVFDPFFTTKEVGRGTGQGLAIAHNIVVQKHHGRIWFDTQPGVGTTFHVRLPLQVMEATHGHSEADPVRR